MESWTSCIGCMSAYLWKMRVRILGVGAGVRGLTCRRKEHGSTHSLFDLVIARCFVVLA